MSARNALIRGYMAARGVPVSWSAPCLLGYPEGDAPEVVWEAAGARIALYEAEYRALPAADRGWGAYCARIHSRTRALIGEVSATGILPPHEGSAPTEPPPVDVWGRCYDAAHPDRLALAALNAWEDAGCPVAGPYSERPPVVAWATLRAIGYGLAHPALTEEGQKAARAGYVAALPLDHPARLAGEFVRREMDRRELHTLAYRARMTAEIVEHAALHAGNGYGVPGGHGALYAAEALVPPPYGRADDLPQALLALLALAEISRERLMALGTECLGGAS